MSLSIGLVGLPNAGKSTLFNALTNQQILVADYPFATIEPNSGVIEIRDSRLTKLNKLFPKAKLIYSTITFTDIAGLIKGASLGEGLGNQFLSHIRQVDLIAHIIAGFKDNDIKININIINTELTLADLQTIEKQLAKFKKNNPSDKEITKLVNILKLAEKDLNNNLMLSKSTHIQTYLDNLKYLNLLTLKPMIYVFNINQNNYKVFQNSIQNEFKKLNYLIIDAKLEMEISQLPLKDKIDFLNEYGLNKSGINRLANLSFKILNKQTFLTAGPNEIRAWTIPNNCPAYKAAGVIHTDIENGFIAADIVSFSDFLNSGSFSQAKAKGLCRTEGRNYLMQEEDIVEFKFNKTK